MLSYHLKYNIYWYFSSTGIQHNPGAHKSKYLKSLLVLLLVIHGGRSPSSLDSKPPFALHTLKDGQTPIEPSKSNISHLGVWKGLPFSALKAPLDKEEQGRLIRV